MKKQIFESITYPIPAMNAIANTPGATLLPDGSIKLMVSRHQKPEQAGGWSVRTGVFYLPELKSPYGRYYNDYRNDNDYGGKQYVTGEVTIHKPYILQADTGGLRLI